MRYLSALLTLLVAFVLVLFATSNREETSLDLFSFVQITAPLYIITFLVLLAGFLFGASWCGTRGGGDGGWHGRPLKKHSLWKQI